MRSIVEERAIAEIGAAPRTLYGPKTRVYKQAGYDIVEGAPSDLAREAGLSLDEYSLARMIASEHGSGTPEELLCLAEATRNKARQRASIYGVRYTVAHLLTVSSYAEAKGRYSEQAAGKWASTRLDATMRSVIAARFALDSETNLCDGAVDFFDPKTQSRGVQGTHVLTTSAGRYISERAQEGLAWVGEIDGVDPYQLMLFKKSRTPVDTAPALAVLETGGGTFRGTGGGLVALAVAAGGALLYLVTKG